MTTRKAGLQAVEEAEWKHSIDSGSPLKTSQRLLALYGW